jgi:hypothetical protein
LGSESATGIFFSRRKLAVLGMAAAAVFVVSVIYFRPAAPISQPMPANDNLATEISPVVPPRLSDYQSALAESPEALDRLLAQHARTLGGSDATSPYDALSENLTGVP